MVEGPIVDLGDLGDFRIDIVAGWEVRHSRTVVEEVVHFQDTVDSVADLGNYSLDLGPDLDLDLDLGRAMKSVNQ